MPAPVASHPSADTLQAFGLGKLDDALVDSVVLHLADCPTCRKAAAAIAPDSFLHQLREAHGLSSTPCTGALSLIERLKQLEASPPPPPRMVSFACPSCGKTFRVKAELAGKKGKCQKCGKPVVVPAAVPPGSDQKTAPPPDQSEHVTLQDNKVPAKRDATSCGPVGRKTKTGEPSAAADSIPVAASYHGSQVAAQEGEVLWDFLAPSQAPDELGRLGPYRVLKVLGHGGMGVVFKAEDPGLKRLVALKAMLPSQAQSPTAKARFVREARAAAALKHDHIVTIYQVGEDRDVPFLAMEFLDGEPLDARLQRESILPVPEVLRIGREIAEGLAAAHEEKLIHRDIKPGNIWLERKNGRAKILDFGLARSTSAETNLTQTGHIVGTPAFMAPEQAGGVEVDHRCDLFSLGCVLYRMSTGEMAFKGADTMAILMSLAVDTPKSPRELNPQVLAGLSDLIMKLLAKDAKDRPASASAVAEELARLASNATKESAFADLQPLLPVKRRRTAVVKPPKPGARRKWLVAAGLLFLAGVAVAGIIIIIRDKHGNKTGQVEVPPGGTVKVTPPQDGSVEVIDDGNGTAKQPKPPPKATGEGKEKWASMFNSKDLSGFVVHSSVAPSDANAWYVEDGVLCANKPGYLLLFDHANASPRGPYGDIKVRAEIKLQVGAELGLVAHNRVRNHPNPSIHFKQHQGYMIRFTCNNDMPSSTGSIDRLVLCYPSINLHEATGTVCEAHKWYHVEMRVEGYRITVLLEDKIIADYDDKEKCYQDGGLGVYLTRGKARIRNLEYKTP